MSRLNNILNGSNGTNGISGTRLSSLIPSTIPNNAVINTPTANTEASQNNGGFIGGVGYLFEKVGAGFLSGVEGIWDYTAGGIAKLFGADDWAEQQFANDWVNYNHADEWYNPSSGWQVAGDVAGGIGTSLPAIVGVGIGAAVAYFSGGSLTPLAAGIISGSIAGLGAAGNATKEAYRETGELGGKEFGYGALSGATEAGLELLSAGMAKGGGRIVSSIAKSTSKEVAETVAKTGAKSVIRQLGEDFAQEAFEEGLAEILSPVYQRMTYNPDAKNASIQEIGYAALVGGLSGMVMSGSRVTIGAAVNTTQNYISGNNAVKNGTVESIMREGETLANAETKHQTGYEAFESVKETFEKLRASLATTGGQVTTVQQKMLLGKLKGATTISRILPYVERSARGLVFSADVAAERYSTFGITDANGKPLNFTAEQLLEGVDTELLAKAKEGSLTDKEARTFALSLRKAIQNNPILSTLAVAEATGQIMLDTRKMAEASLNGQNLANAADLNYLIENGSQEEMDALAEAFGIEDWSKVTIDDFRAKVSEFNASGRISEYAEQSKRVHKAAEQASESAKPLPHLLRRNMTDGVYRYKGGDGAVDMAVIKEGDNYFLYDYEGRHISRALSMQDVNKVLKRFWASGQTVATTAKSMQNNQETTTARATAEIEALAKEVVGENYNKLNEPTKAAVRMTIRQAQAHGLSDVQVRTFAKVAARTGVNIIFDEQKALGDGSYSARDNAIYVNPKNSAERTYEIILGHEMFHAIFADGEKGALSLFLEAKQLIDEETAEKTRSRYKGFYDQVGGVSATQANVIAEEEVAARGVEEAFKSEAVWDYILSKEPSFADKVLSFFRQSAREYSELQGMSSQARKFIRQYKKLFDSLSEKHQGTNALALTLEGANAKKITATSTFDENMRVTGDNDEDNETLEGDDGTRLALTESATPKITAEMSDAERAEILSKKQVVAPIYTGQADAAILANKDKLESGKVGIVTGVIQKLGEDFGVVGEEINIEDVEVVITLSKSNLRKSVTAEATPGQLAKLIPVLKDTARSAIGIERHDNRYFFDSDTVYFDNLLGGYIDGNNFVPVRFGLKHSRTGNVVLYVVVDQNKIPLSSLIEMKKTEVVKTPAANADPEVSRSVTYSIAQIIEFVNSRDLLRYIPDEMLTEAQKTTKYEAIAKTIERTNAKNDERYAEYISNGDLDAAKQMVFNAAKAAGYTIEGYHGTRQTFTAFSNESKGSNTRTETSKRMFFAADKATANSYYPYGVMQAIHEQHPEWAWADPEKVKVKGNLYHLFIRMSNPLTVDVADYDYAAHRDNADSWMEFVAQAEANHNDGIILLNAMDNQLDTSARASTVYMFAQPSQAKSAETITYDDEGNIIPISKRFDASTSDMRYALTGDETETQHKINTSMTMAEARRMVETAYRVNNIAEYYAGEYTDAEDWLRKAGSDEVEMYIENDFDLQAKYVNSNEDILNEEYRIADVLEAYLAGTLVGKPAPKPTRLDVSQSTRIQDTRFYAPQQVQDARALYEVAIKKATGKDALAVTRARSQILLFAHNKGAAELLGITQAELNKKLRSWSNYSATAREISQKINAGVAEQNRWTGIENCAYISKANVSEEDVGRLVASIEGESRGFERRYIARVMLAADTHIDYSGLHFKFASAATVNADNKGGSGRVNGFYRDDARLIEVAYDKPNTVAHEMGHYLDAQWGRDLVGSSTTSHLWLTSGVNADIVRERYGEAGVTFLNNFKMFINSLADVNSTYSSYTNDRKEIFARFFARFIEWTDNIATGNKYYSMESAAYGDKFTQAQFVEFARLLQEKALLDGSIATNASVAEVDADTRYALLPDTVEQDVLEKHGKTFNWNTTGYIFKNGTRLDLSGKNVGATGGYRAIDHRDIFDIYTLDSYTDAMIEFMRRGNVRVVPESPGINLIVEPTEAQYEQITSLVERLGWREKEFRVDFDNENGDTVDSLYYEGNVSARKVVADIRHFFKEGTVPYQSDLSQFRYALTEDENLDDIFAELASFSDSGPAFDIQKVIDRGLPRRPGASTLTVGELKKVIANNTRDKVYSKKNALEIVSRFYGVSDLTAKTRGEIADALWQGLNDCTDAEERATFAHDMAEFIVAKMLTEAKVENPDIIEAKEKLTYLSTYIGKLTFSPQDISELRHIADKDGLRRLLGRWGYKGRKISLGNGTATVARATPMDVFVCDIAREMPGMADFEDMHPAEAFIELDAIYERAKEDVKDKWISAYWDMPDSDIPAMVQGVEEEILKAFMTDGAKSKFAKLVEGKIESAQRRADFWKAEHDSIKGRDRLLGFLMAQAQKMNDLRIGKYKNSTQFESELFRNSIEKLAKIKFRGNLNVSGTRGIFSDLLLWYQGSKTTLLEYVDAENPGYYSEAIEEALRTIAEGQGGFTKADLSTMIDVMGHFIHFVENYGKVWRSGQMVEALPLAQEYNRIIERNKTLKVGLFGKLAGSWYAELFLDPQALCERMDYYDHGFFTQMFEELRAAAKGADVAEMDIMSDYDAFLRENKKYIANISTETVEYRGHQIPKAQLIDLYMTMKRKQAWAGAAYNGFNFKNLKGDVERVDGFLTAEVETEEELEAAIQVELDTIAKNFTDTDRAYMAIVERGYNERAKALKVERDMARMGYTNASDGYYYPISRAYTSKTIDADPIKAEFDRVSNASFNKDIVKGARQELALSSVDARYRRHIHAVCQYAYLQPAIETFNRLYNLDISGNKNHPVSVRTASENVWKKGNLYFKKLISDIQGIPTGSSEGMAALAFIRGSYAKYQLGANPKVWFTQLSSIFASTSILDYDCIVRGMGVSSSDIDTYCPLARLRNYDNTAAMAQGVLDRSGKAYGRTGKMMNKVGEVSDLLMKPIGMMDRFVVSRLFGACQVQVEKNGGAKVGTEENKIEAGKLLEKVIFETQQNSIATERSGAMRSSNEILRTLTMFTSDSMKVIGRVISAYGEVSVLKARIKAETDADAKAELQARLKKAQKKLAKSSAALAMTAIFMALIAQAFRWLYKKDDEEDNIPLNMTLDAVGNLFGGLPLVKDAYAKLVEGYDLDNYAYSAVNDLLDGAKNLMTTAGNVFSNEASSQEVALGIKNFIYSIGQATGIPVRNIYNVFYGLTKRFNGEAAYKIDNVFYEKNYKNDFYKAIESGDTEMATFIMSLLYNERMGENMSATTHSELYSLSAKGFKVIPKSVASSITIDGQEYELSEAEIAAVRANYSTAQSGLEKLFANASYSALTDELKADAVNYLYDLYYDQAIEETLGVDRGNGALVAKAVGADTLALLYVATKGLESDKDKNGNTVSGSKRKKVLAAIKKLNIPTQQKLLLLCAKGYSIQDGDIKGYSAEKAKKYLLNYLLHLTSLTKEQKAELAVLCGFEVKNGKIVQKTSTKQN